MDNNENIHHTSFQRASRQLPITLTQLVRVSRAAHDIDEFLTWLAYLMVRELNIQVIQFWANQASSTGRNSPVLRTMAIQERSFPSHVIVNARVVEAVDFLLKERRGAMLQQVQRAFAPHQANLLSRYGMNYSFAHFQSHASLIPPLANARATSGDIATPYAMIVLLFWRQLPQHSTIPTVVAILDKVEPAAVQGNLLLPPDTSAGLQSIPTTGVHLQGISASSELVPRRTRDSETLREYSPFSTSIPIQGKEAQRLYQAIDGRKSLAELAALTKLNSKDMATALRSLVAQNLISVCNKVGQPISEPWLLD